MWRGSELSMGFRLNCAAVWDDQFQDNTDNTTLAELTILRRPPYPVV